MDQRTCTLAIPGAGLGGFPIAHATHRPTTLDKLSTDRLGKDGHAWATNHRRGGRYYRMLTRMPFAAAPFGARWRVSERFLRPQGSLAAPDRFGAFIRFAEAGR